MTTSNDLPGDQPSALEPATTDTTKGRMPWSPKDALAAKQAQQPWHLKGSNPKHEKKIGMAPRNTRRSMGKR